MATPDPGSAARVERWLANLRDEEDGVALYEGLAEVERDAGRAQTFRELAAGERRHAAFWRGKLAEGGVPVPAARPSARVRLLLRLARWLGTGAVLPLVIQLEVAGARKYAAPGSEGQDLSSEEAAHRDALNAMRAGAASEAHGGARPGAASDARTGILAREDWHRGRSGSIRAAVFGINDGLVSNVSLLLGVAAAGSERSTLLVTGLAGLFAGAFSMAVGEYVSVASQRDLLRRQVELEARELAEAPEEEEAELAGLLERKGIAPEVARRTAAEILRNPETALDTLVREELGLDPADLGSPGGAAASSFVMFALGAALPILPFLFASGMTAAVASAVLAALVLAAVGAFLAVLSGTSVARGILRMAGLAALAAGTTIAVGSFLGTRLE